MKVKNKVTRLAGTSTHAFTTHVLWKTGVTLNNFDVWIDIQYIQTLVEVLTYFLVPVKSPAEEEHWREQSQAFFDDSLQVF